MVWKDNWISFYAFLTFWAATTLISLHREVKNEIGNHEQQYREIKSYSIHPAKMLEKDHSLFKWGPQLSNAIHLSRVLSDPDTTSCRPFPVVSGSSFCVFKCLLTVGSPTSAGNSLSSLFISLDNMMLQVKNDSKIGTWWWLSGPTRSTFLSLQSAMNLYCANVLCIGIFSAPMTEW